MAASNLILQLGEIPSEGTPLQGEIGPEIFDLKDGLAKPRSGLGYDLTATLVDGQVVLQGHLEANFELVCTHSSKRFTHKVRLDPYLESVEPENSEFLDLTDQLREDILLALPAYPRAPGSDADGDLPLAASSQEEPNQGESGRSEWDALDGLKTND